MKKQKKSLFRQVLRFICTGAVTVGLYYGILYTLTEFFQFWYLLSAIIAYIFNITGNFLLHKFWTFKNIETEKIRQQMFWYLFMWFILFLANTGLLYLFVDILHIWYLYAQMIITVVFSIISYFVTRRIFVTKAL